MEQGQLWVDLNMNFQGALKKLLVQLLQGGFNSAFTLLESV